MNFESLGLIEPLLKALRTEGYEKPTPIQQQAIPIVLQGTDLLGCAQTGTGKTAAFALPVIQLLHNHKIDQKGKRPIRSLILTPTRELAIQIEESFKAYGRHTPLKYLVVFGGVGQFPQTQALRAGTDVLIATPGRLLDLMNQGFIDLRQLEIFILDEADRMLDMGFIHDVKRVIAKLPAQRQSLFFSATMPPEIQRLSATILTNPKKVEVTPPATTAEKINQSIYYLDKAEKKSMLLHVLSDHTIERALVFTRTKHGANKVVKDLQSKGITAEAIHGNKSQSARQQALKNFKNKATRVLVATDIAARGIDVDDLTHVINYEIPNVPETYVHRIGRTGRAGASGIAISFCEAEEVSYIKDIQKLTGLIIPHGEDRGQVPMPSFDINKGLPAPPEHSGRGQRQGQRHKGPKPGGDRKQGQPKGQSSQGSDNRLGDNRKNDNRRNDNRNTDQRNNDNRRNDNRNSSGRSNDSRSGENRGGESRSGDNRRTNNRNGNNRRNNDTQSGNPRRDSSSSAASSSQGNSTPKKNKWSEFFKRFK
jgi:ATP-dependent RNA helicase RhlE